MDGQLGSPKLRVCGQMAAFSVCSTCAALRLSSLREWPLALKYAEKPAAPDELASCKTLGIPSVLLAR